MKEQIKKYFEALTPTKLHLTGKVPAQVEELGLGESNLNFLVTCGGKRFIFRMQLDAKSQGAPREEFNGLKAIEKLGIAPRAILVDDSHKHFDNSFLILEYLAGEAFSSGAHLTDLQFRMLARELALLHNLRVKKLKLAEGRLTFSGYLKHAGNYLKYIRDKRKKYFEQDRFDELLDESFAAARKIAADAARRYKETLCLCHGDVAPQNIISCNGQLKLIDWESVGLGDPAAEATFVLNRVSFPSTEKQRELFLKEYKKWRTDKTLDARIMLFSKIISFEQFLWSIMHIYEILENEMHPEYMKKLDMQGHLSYQQECFRKFIKAGVIGTRWSEVKGLEIFPKSLIPES